MSIECARCKSKRYVKNGLVRGVQRYRCVGCGYNYTLEDRRSTYDNKTRNLVIRMYLNNCGFRRIAEILSIPLSTVFKWIKKAGKIVDEMVSARQEEAEKIEILEMDELYTYIKKNQEETKRLGRSKDHTPEFGLLWIGTDLKLLRLK